jgi:hypothetical protein
MRRYELSTKLILVIIGLTALSGLVLPSAIAATLAEPNTVNSAAIIDGQVKKADIASNSVSYSKIQSGAIDGSKIQDGTVKLADLAANSVDSGKIVDGAVTSDDLDSNVFDAMQAQIDAQQAEIEDLKTRVQALEEAGGGGGSGDTQCSDGIDNDSDTLIDTDDPGCTDSSDDSEDSLVTACSDGIDNDADTFIDLADAGCADANDTSEEDPINPEGTFDLDPVPTYACGFGLVSFSPEQFVFSGTSTLIVNGEGLPQMSGEYAGDGSIDVSGSIAGSCTETYSLTGQFTDADSWIGTFTAQYTGGDCNVSGDECTNQSWSVEGQRAIAE